MKASYLADLQLELPCVDCFNLLPESRICFTSQSLSKCMHLLTFPQLEVGRLELALSRKQLHLALVRAASYCLQAGKQSQQTGM